VELVNDAAKSPKKLKNFKEVEPWDWGKDSENSSNDIDEILYGGKL
jgi:hypothetical protein